jgi:hypothetical protein
MASKKINKIQCVARPPPAAYGRVKLSPFWPNNPVTWFAMAEGQFILNNIADRTSSITSSSTLYRNPVSLSSPTW